jgi:hypothetical protein
VRNRGIVAAAFTVLLLTVRYRMRGVPFVAVVDSTGTLAHARFAAVPAGSAALDSILDIARGAPSSY